MAASYSTGAAASPADFFTKLMTWLQAQGWSVNMNAPAGAGTRAHLQRSGVYLNLRLANQESGTYFNQAYNFTGVAMYTSTGYDAAKGFSQQPGGASNGAGTDMFVTAMGLPTGALTAYHFFDDGAGNVTVVVERTSGIFSYMGWGQLIKAGAYTGGAFYFGSRDYYNSGITNGPGSAAQTANSPFDGSIQSERPGFVRANVDAFVGKWLTLNDGTDTVTGKRMDSTSTKTTANIPHYNVWNTYQTAAADGSTNLLPIRLYAERDAGGHSLLGDVPNLFQSNAVGKGYAASSVLTLGTDNYMLFPNFAVKKPA